MLVLVALASAALSLLPVAAAKFPPAMFSEKAALHPALDQRLDPGPWCAAAGLALWAGAGAIAAGLDRQSWRERAWLALGCAALASYTVVFAFVLPRLDAQMNAPLRRLAARAGELTPPGERVLVLGLRHAASICFYGARATEYVSDSGGKYAEAEVFAPDHPRIGISGVAQLSHFGNTERLEVLEHDGGYVLFRIPDASSGAGAPPP
jgi:hypothetical protein